MELKIALLPGDGIGPEIVGEAVKVLDRVAAKYGHVFKYEKALVGACAIDATGDPYPAETHAVCLRSDAVLFGAIGDPKYDNDPSAKVRPEQGLLRMRKSLGLYANLRPLAVFDSLAGRSPLKTEIVRGADFLCVRELTGGMYFGRPQGRSEDGNTAYDTCVYTREEIERILRLAFELARKRRKHLTVVDKANVIATSRLWRQIAGEMAPRYADVQLEFMFVDNAAMQIIQRPTHFDVIVTENLFGDILTDEASVISGSLGMLPSASGRRGGGAVRADSRKLSSGRGQEHRQSDGDDPFGRYAARARGARKGGKDRPRGGQPGDRVGRRDRGSGQRRRQGLFDDRRRRFHRCGCLNLVPIGRVGPERRFRDRQRAVGQSLTALCLRILSGLRGSVSAER